MAQVGLRGPRIVTLVGQGETHGHAMQLLRGKRHLSRGSAYPKIRLFRRSIRPGQFHEPNAHSQIETCVIEPFLPWDARPKTT